MEARTQDVKGVFQNNTLLEIPYYQRRYVWNDGPEYLNWSRFAEDMESTLETDSKYFLGALILKSARRTEEDMRNGIARRMIVVDGQQRLTTMAIYMKLLHQLTSHEVEFESYYQLDNNAKDPTIRHNCEDRRDFNRIILDDTPGEKEGDNLIIGANNFFYNRFVYLRDEKGIRLDDLRRAINANVNFVVIELSAEEDEQQIFDTINSLGVDLTTDELLKNYLYGPDDEERYNLTWKRRFDLDESKQFWGTDATSQKQTKKDKVLDRFLSAFVKLKMWDFTLDPMHRKEFVKVGSVYKACKSFCERYGMEKLALADEILRYAEIYRENFDKSVLDERIPQHSDIKRLACLINANQSYAVLPYALYVLGNVEDLSERNRIFGYLETYLVRRLLCKSSSNSYSDLFAENLIGNQVKTYNGLREYIENIDPSRNLAMPSNEEIQVQLGQVKLDERLSLTILYLYETKLRSSDNENGLKEGINYYSVVRLMPKPCVEANNNWPPANDVLEEANRKDAIQTLGNAFMFEDIDEKEFKKVNNKGFQEKKSVYENYLGKVQSSNVLRTHNTWNVDRIKTRNEQFAKILSEQIWSV